MKNIYNSIYKKTSIKNITIFNKIIAVNLKNLFLLNEYNFSFFNNYHLHLKSFDLILVWHCTSFLQIIKMFHYLAILLC